MFPWYRCRARVDAKVLLNVGDTAPLTSASSPALPRFDTNVRAPTFNVPECPRRPSRLPPVVVNIITLDVAILDDASDAFDVAQPNAFNALDSPLAPLLSRASNIDGTSLITNH